MSKIQEAKFLDGYISIEDYEDKKHYQQIYCPECYKAPIHIVIKQKAKPYFASNRKEEHLEDCQHHEEFIKNESLNILINSYKPEDKNRLEFLIKSNLNSALKIFQKNNESTKINSISNNSSQQTKIGNSKIYKNESIPRISINNIRRRTEFLDCYVVVYGRTNLQVLLHTKEDKYTKQLVFKIEDKSIFSIFLSKKQTEYFETKPGNYSVVFAVFGELFQRDKFLNLRIMTTENLKLLDT